MTVLGDEQGWGIRLDLQSSLQHARGRLAEGNHPRDRFTPRTQGTGDEDTPIHGMQGRLKQGPKDGLGFRASDHVRTSPSR